MSVKGYKVFNSDWTCFADAKAADKPSARDFDQQTQNYTREEKTAQSAPQPAYTQGSLDDFAVISDTDDLPF